MICYKHSNVGATVTCPGCGRAMCNDCYNRFTLKLCEDCLVANNDMK